MLISEIAQNVGCECILMSKPDEEIKAGYTSDLLSDVMGNAEPNSILITIQAHKNTVAVVSLKDMKAIIICNNRPIPDDMIESAKDEGISIFRTHENQFQVSGKLFLKLNS